jgi:hypothetical protein
MSHAMAQKRLPKGMPDAKRPLKTGRVRVPPRYYLTASKIGAWRLVIWNSLN